MEGRMKEEMNEGKKERGSEAGGTKECPSSVSSVLIFFSSSSFLFLLFLKIAFIFSSLI